MGRISDALIDIESAFGDACADVFGTDFAAARAAGDSDYTTRLGALYTHMQNNLSPVVFALVTPQLVREMLEEWSEVGE